MNEASFILEDSAATEALGAVLARSEAARAGLVVFLEGDLGAGKTTLARGWLRALGISGPIRSPTYTLIEPYRVDGRELLHMDLYRLRSPDELEGLGLDDYPPDRSWWLVEWPAQGGALLPPADLLITLQVDEGKRKVSLSGPLGAAAAAAARAAGFAPKVGDNLK